MSFLCVWALVDDGLRHSIVKVGMEPGAAGEWFRAKLGQCCDVVCLRWEDSRIKNRRQFVFYNNKIPKWSNAGIK